MAERAAGRFDDSSASREAGNGGVDNDLDYGTVVIRAVLLGGRFVGADG